MRKYNETGKINLMSSGVVEGNAGGKFEVAMDKTTSFFQLTKEVQWKKNE